MIYYFAMLIVRRPFTEVSTPGSLIRGSGLILIDFRYPISLPRALDGTRVEATRSGKMDGSVVDKGSELSTGVGGWAEKFRDYEWSDYRF